MPPPIQYCCIAFTHDWSHVGSRQEVTIYLVCGTAGAGRVIDFRLGSILADSPAVCKIAALEGRMSRHYRDLLVMSSSTKTL